jgi:hypothetical protein
MRREFAARTPVLWRIFLLYSQRAMTTPADRSMTASPSTRPMVFLRGDRPEVARKLILGAVLATLGALLVLCFAVSATITEKYGIAENVRSTGSIVGSALLLTGLGLGFVSVPQALFLELSLEVRHDLMVFDWGKSEREEILWDDVRSIREEEAALVIVTRTKERRIETRFGGKSHGELASLLERSWQRARLGI